ncbi:beta-galactosidase subunit beta [Streptococcus pneumoniae]|nr:beta-galactosidase subunit beta [Streptococcus pneumoniae]
MIITKISRLGTYVGVNPHFATLIDFLEKTGLENLVEQLVHLRAGECLITFPEDLHQPKVRINDEPVKKVVFKVAIS